MADCNKKNTLVNLEYVLYFKLNKTHHPDVSAKGEHFTRKEKALIWRTASKETYYPCLPSPFLLCN